jgi:hypothetical protein
VGKRPEQRLVEQFVAQATVEAFDEAVLLGFTRGDVMPADTRLIRPLQDGVRGVFRAVIADDSFGSPAPLADDGVQLPRDAQRAVFSGHGFEICRGRVGPG